MPGENEEVAVEGTPSEAATDVTPDSGQQDQGTPAAAEPPAKPEGKEDPAGGDTEGEEGAQPQAAAAQFKASLKFKAAVYNKETKALEHKEYDIDPKFNTLMKTPEDEKLVRELHEKAYGLESVKERYTETKAIAQEIARENQTIQSQIGELRNIYQSAVQSGNLHKLDRWFAKLQIPQDVVLQYALEKAKLAELPPEQKNAVLGQLKAETQAEQFEQQQAQMRDLLHQQVQQTKQTQLEFVMSRPDVSQLAQAFDAKQGIGAFKRTVIQAGEYAWLKSGGRIDLTPDQAVQEVVKSYGLSAAQAQGAPASASPGSVAASAQKAPAKTIPNISGRAGSPIKSKPMSLDDLKKLAKQAAQVS